MSDAIEQSDFLLCRQKLGASLAELLKAGKKRGIKDDDILWIIREADDRNDAFYGLKDIGLSLQDIGSVMNLTRERIRQLAKNPGTWAKRRIRVKTSLEEMEKMTISLAWADPDWWNEDDDAVKMNARMKSDKLKQLFEEHGYDTNDQAPWKDLDLSKARVLIEGSSKLPPSEHRKWVMSLRQKQGMTQAEIWRWISSQTRVKISLMAINRYFTHTLGIHEYTTNAGNVVIHA